MKQAGLWVGAVVSMLGALAAPAETPRDSKVAFDLAAQPLEEALNALAVQSKLHIVFNTADAAGMTSPAINGTYTPAEVLQKLLARTDLRYEFVNDRTVEIRAGRREGDERAESGFPAVGNAVRVAQAEEGVATGAGQQQAAPQDQEKDEGTQLEEIVVTGTHIRGPQRSTTPVTIYSREDLERSGYSTTQDFIRSLPQNFKGGAKGASEDGPLSNPQNLESASGVNLRGLGANSSLVLLDGRRVAASTYGEYFDVSMLPLSAIERVEVLTDGASAIYGADAVGGVVNFVLRKDYDRAESELRLGTAAHSGRDERIVGQTVGQSWSGGSALAALQYQNIDRLRADERSFTDDIAICGSDSCDVDLYPSVEQYSGIFSVRQDLSTRADVFADVLLTRKDVRRNFDRPTRADDNFARAHYMAASGGAAWQAFGAWRLEASGGYSQAKTTVREFYAPPVPDYVNGSPELINNFIVTNADLKADGKLFSLPAGEVKAALGISYRDEDFASLILSPLPRRDRIYRRNVKAAFGELYIPVISATHGVPLMRGLTVSAAVRMDDYSDFGETANPKFGVLWSLTDQLDLRASYGTSFRAPNPNESIQTITNEVAFIVDGFALPEGGTGNVLLATSAVPLEPEEAENLTAGLQLRSASLPGLELSVNYFDITYENRIIVPPFDASMLLQPQVYGPLLSSFSSDTQAQGFVTQLVNQGFQFFDFTTNQTGIAGVRHASVIGLVNASVVDLNGFDVGAKYGFAVGQDDLVLSLNATRINEILSGFCTDCTATDLANQYGQPLKWRARGAAGWTHGPWQLNGAVNYSNSYADTSVVPAGRIDSWTTFDLNARYAPAWLRDGEIGVNVINVFDKAPPRTGAPIVVNGEWSVQYDAGNADPLGRVVSLQLRKAW